MTIAEQRRELRRIGIALINIANNDPFNWRAAKELRDALGEALITEVAKQKRQRYLDRRAARRASNHG